MFMIILYHGFYFYADNQWSLGGTTIETWDRVDTFLDIIDLPMFVFISGFLYSYLFIFKGKYRNKKQFIASKAMRLLHPYIIWGLLLIIFMPSIFSLHNLLTGCGHLWFLLMLFGVFVFITPVSKYLLLNSSSFWMPVIITICSVGLLFAFHFVSSHHFVLCSHAILYYMPFFILGMFSAKHQLWQKKGNKYPLIILIVSLFLLILYVIIGKTNIFYIDYTIRLILGTTIIIATLILLSHITISTKVSQIINHFDKIAMGIYIIHAIILNAILMTDGAKVYFNIHYYAGPFILSGASFIGGWILSYLFYRHKWLSWTIGG